MFYVKEKINPSVDLTIDLHDDNVFCICPNCGCEVEIDLAELFRDGESDLYGTSVFCAECSKTKLKNLKKRGVSYE